jgi:DNA-binding FrmR family transcriptional regulator
MLYKEIAFLDILTQVATVTSAIKKAGTIIIRASIEECLEKSWKGHIFK